MREGVYFFFHYCQVENSVRYKKISSNRIFFCVVNVFFNFIHFLISQTNIMGHKFSRKRSITTSTEFQYKPTTSVLYQSSQDTLRRSRLIARQQAQQDFGRQNQFIQINRNNNALMTKIDWKAIRKHSLFYINMINKYYLRKNKI